MYSIEDVVIAIIRLGIKHLRNTTQLKESHKIVDGTMG